MEKKIKTIKKSEFDFDITKIKEVETINVFDDYIEIVFILD